MYVGNSAENRFSAGKMYEKPRVSIRKDFLHCNTVYLDLNCPDIVMVVET
jgi:hypothetical protein